MKKSIFIKFITGTTLVVALVFMLLAGWANWTPASYTEKNVPSTVFVTYDISSTNKSNYLNLENAISEIGGVTACTLNSNDKSVGVMFSTSLISKEEMLQSLTSLLRSKVREKTIEPSVNACPVGGITYFFLGLKQTLRVRT